MRREFLFGEKECDGNIETPLGVVCRSLVVYSGCARYSARV